MTTTIDEPITSPWSDNWPTTESGIPIINVERLMKTWELRTGRVNIALNWAHFGDVLDPAWLAEHHQELDDDVAISLWMDFVSFHGDDDLTAQAEVLTPRIAAMWDEEDELPTSREGASGKGSD